MRKIFVLLTLSLVIFSSGCTVPFLNIEIPFLPDIFPGMQITEQRHDVISIEGLQAIPFSTVRSGQSIRLRAVIKNLQKPEYEPKEDVIIGLYNDCGIFDVDVEFCQGSESQDRDPDTGMYQCTLKRMYPQSTAIVEWKLTAKDVNVETSCKVGILAKYDHTTYSTGSVTFVDKIELERLVSEGKSFSETGIATIGEGPVKPYIEVLNQPIMIDNSKPTKDAGSGIMSFWIENKGYGLLDISESTTENVVLPDPPSSCKDFKPEIRTGNTITKRICLKIESTNNKIKTIKTIDKDNVRIINIQDCIKEHLKTPKEKHSVSFIGKSTPKYSCSIGVDDPSMVKQEKTYQITAEVAYSYKFTKEIMLTIQPRIRL